ncbi:MAG TPA: hypothetical protein VFV75_02130 [Candidatus Polarisedimenticolaceae bacterium]|nr:hypothetical protein [Candidatus Polarisedimenticolaceae bacterium]
MLACFLVLAAASGVPPEALQGLSWRLVGPHRAGWSTAVAGVPQAPDTFFFGAAGGGVWKTTDAGRTWSPIFDQGPASVGALAVAPSDPRIVYVGTGQVTSRYDIAAGEGVFKSTDGGATWSSAGLEATRHIGALRVDPRNAAVVLVAALGHAFGPNPERGVFRSEDGGKTWQRTLYVSENTGAVDLAADPLLPDVVFASVWQVRQRPWLSYFTPSLGEESGVYRSSNGGRTWARVAGGGWPAGKLGRIGLAAAHAGDATRVYAVVEGEQSCGLYRSDDAGITWKCANSNPGIASSYFGRVYVHPADPDTVFVLGRSLLRCGAGGEECEVFKGSPGGDDYHHMWVDPGNPERMILGADQGAAVSVNGGATWSSWYNQPTGQFYHLATDDRFPYRIYSGQQDSGTVSIASRTDHAGITFRDWHPVGADERDFDLPDPEDPDVVYGTGLGGRLSRWDAANGEVQNVSPWPISSYGARPTTVRYAYSWITPLAISKVPPYPLYQGAQVLFRSEDKGAHWQVLDPALSPPGAKDAACGGDPTPAQARTCGYGTIATIGLSPKDNTTLWIGTDDGRVKRSADAGATWQDVTPKDLPLWAKVGVDVPGPDGDTAYLAVDNHRRDDFRPHAWRTHDAGKTWTSIARGLPPGQYVSVLRGDPAQPGLLYAGTDRGVLVSFDDGAHWRPLQRGLPTVIVTDLLVHGDDLVAATQGRALWVLDGITPLRELADTGLRGPAHLFAPAPAVRVRGNQNKDTPLPPEEPLAQNPPAGAVIDYWLERDGLAPVRLEIRDLQGALVRRFASDVPEEGLPAERYFEERWVRPTPPLPAGAGAHRVVWDLRGPRPPASRYAFSIAAVDGQDTPRLPRGMLVPPGEYRVVLTAGGGEIARDLRVVADPRVPVDAAALAAAEELSRTVVAALERQVRAMREMEHVGKAVYVASISNDLPQSAGKAIAAFQAALAPLTAADGALASACESLQEIQIDLEGSDRAPTEPQRQAVAAEITRLAPARELWERVKRTDLPALNAVLRAAGLDPISVP